MEALILSITKILPSLYFTIPWMYTSFSWSNLAATMASLNLSPIIKKKQIWREHIAPLSRRLPGSTLYIFPQLTSLLQPERPCMRTPSCTREKRMRSVILWGGGSVLSLSCSSVFGIEQWKLAQLTNVVTRSRNPNNCSMIFVLTKQNLSRMDIGKQWEAFDSPYFKS